VDLLLEGQNRSGIEMAQPIGQFRLVQVASRFTARSRSAGHALRQCRAPKSVSDMARPCSSSRRLT
jgi:hypothetical protein